MIADAGTARHGEDFERMWGSFVDCRIHRTEELVDFPADDREALYRLVRDLMPAADAVHAEVRSALQRVKSEWRYGGLVAAAAEGGLYSLDCMEEREEPETFQNRIMWVVSFMDIDVAAQDVRGELGHIAFSQSLFW